MSESDSPSPKRSINDLFKVMAKFQEDFKTSSKCQIDKIDDLKTDVNQKFNNIDSRISTIDEKVNKSNATIISLQNKVNEMDQDKLAMQMDITGISNEDIEHNRADPKLFAYKIISSFQIVLSPRDIQKAYIRELKKTNRSVVVVTFTSTELKYNVMKKKRECKETRNIFFDHSMTAATRELFFLSRKAVKESNAKTAFVSNGKVYIAADDNSKIRIQSAADLDRFKQQPGTSNATGPSGSRHSKNE